MAGAGHAACDLRRDLFLEHEQGGIGACSMASPSVLVWGRSRAGAAAQVANAVLAFDRLKGSVAPAEAVPAACGPPHGGGQHGRACMYPLRFDTKYYTADLTLQVLQVGVGQQPPQLNHGAVIVAFDASVPSPPAAGGPVIGAAGTESGVFNRLSATLGPVLVERGPDAAADDPGPAVRLLVAINVPNGALGSTERAKCDQWCAVRGFEFLYVAGNISCAADVLSGAFSRDKDGIARVVEALQAHSWSNMSLKPRVPAVGGIQTSGSGGCGSDRGVAGLPASLGDFGTVRAGAGASSAAAVPPPIPPACAAMGPAETRGAVEGVGLPVLSDVLSFDKDDDGAGGGGLGTLECLLGEMQQVRNNAAKLSDADRRAAAAKTAMKLFAALELADAASAEQ